MKLEIGNFYVKDIQFGEVTKFADGILTVNKEEAIRALNPDQKLKNIELYIARPGESIRILPIKEVVAPRARKDGRAAFPGYTGEIAPCGDGVLYALQNMSVMAVGKYAGFPDGMVDMDGPATELTHYSEIINLVFVAENVDPEEERGDIHKTNGNYRLGAHLLAEYLAKAVLDQAPQDRERYELTDVSDKRLPKVAFVMQVTTSWRKNLGYDSLFYGKDTIYLVPTLVHPNELLDGCLTSCSVLYGSAINHTYDYQNFPILKELYAEHGKSIDFVGVLFDVNDTEYDMKERASIRIATMAEMLGCQGVITMEHGGCGHSDVDFFLTIAKLEEKGIKTVGVCIEGPGRDGVSQTKAILDPKADAIVSTGDNTALIELPPMDQVIGYIDTINRDAYPGTWADDPLLGPSLRSDGSLIVETHLICGHDGESGWSHKTCKSY